jgi:hypothetical protein
MAQLAGRNIAWMLLLAIILATGSGWAQAPCTDAQALQTPGTLTLDAREQADMDRRLRSKPELAVLNKINQTIALLKQSLPDLKGIKGQYWHEIVEPGPGSHVLRFWITAAFFDFYCVPAGGYPPGSAEKVRPSDETGTWIYIYFNSLGWLTNKGASLGQEMLTPKGETIFLLPRENGEWKGHRAFAPDLHGETSGAILITPPGRFPFKPVSRDDLIAARIAQEQKYLDDAKSKLGPGAPVVNERGRRIQDLRKLRDSMTAEELQSQAIVREWSADPTHGKLFVTEAERGLPLVTVDRTYIDPSLPPSAVQLITVYWRWNDDVPVKREMMRQFKTNFDLAALERLLDR